MHAAAKTHSTIPVLWLVLGIPAATVLAGFWTLAVAMGESATDAAPDPVRRTAQVQVVALDADRLAAERGLSAVLRLSPAGVVVQVDGPAGTRAPVLQLVHPIESTLDRTLALSPGPEGWRSAEPVAAAHAWQVRLLAGDGQWRLVGRYRPGENTVVLAPALEAP